MHDTDLKYNILDKIISINDESLLRKVNELIGDVDLDQTIVKVSEEQRQMLIKSEEDIKNGNLFSDEEVNNEEQQWLNG